MRCDPEQIAAAGAEQLMQHRKAGVLGREVRVVGEGDRERTWGTGINSLKLGTLEAAWERIPGGKLTADMATSPNANKRREQRSYFQNGCFPKEKIGTRNARLAVSRDRA